MEWKRNRIIIIRFSISTKPSLFYYVPIFLFTISALFYSSISFTTTCPDGRCSMSAKADHTYFQGSEKPPEKMVTPPPLMKTAPRYLSGIGSSPPRCLWKCGNCRPCKPVHVPVPPGNPVTAEYYPEAWRCKCGNKLYMP
ncbi:EPIDERMAL PATTERNING FACTOR-like protein 6 [Humulus lupulus]|uniref:EPIDERMAL PATTERNING FACTOR-like protein 6 n=1 Tax=Humulus lupulus TaxID=3486 RepID=UPI002B40E23D|nr:EPIDERMAL PATTERNING FACTOR-like protein 6 [Humulus lupulus]